MREVANAHEGVEGGALDAELRRLCEGGRPTEAATLAIRRLGPELLRFLTHALRDETRAGDAFSLFAEDVWRGLPGFRSESSFRTAGPISSSAARPLGKPAVRRPAA